MTEEPVLVATTRTAVECLLVCLVREKPTACRVPDRPTAMFRHWAEVAWVYRESRAQAVEFLVVSPGGGDRLLCWRNLVGGIGMDVGQGGGVGGVSGWRGKFQNI